MGELCIKDAIISCLRSQLDCYKDISKFDKRLTEIDKKLFSLSEDQIRFDKELYEYYERLENFEKRLQSNLIDYIDNYVEAYIKKKEREKKIKKHNTIKVLYLFFTIFLSLCIVYYTIITNIS